MQTIQVQQADGVYSCDIGIHKEEWLEILKDKNLPDKYRDALLRFYYMPKHRGSCTAVSKEIGGNALSLNSYIINVGRFVQKKLNRFQVVNSDGTSCFWIIPMNDGKYLPKDSVGKFEWLLRPELVEAIRDYLYWYLVERYKELRRTLYFRDKENDWDELYKWELITASEGKTPWEIVKASINTPNDSTKGGFNNLVYPTGYGMSMKYLMENKSTELQEIIIRLADDAQPLNSRLANFKSSISSLLPEKGYNSKANDERTAATILTCCNPDIYTFYKHDVMYDRFCKYLGEEMEKTGACYQHYLLLIEPLAKCAEEDSALQELIKPMLKGMRQSRLLLAQDILWMLLRGKPEHLGFIYYLLFCENTNDMVDNNIYEPYINLLEANKNLILTGAPGTGKTFMAKAIAEEMNAEVGFVQFHPSYDYTDFVEGLRPIYGENSQIGFKRKDGVFKEFCNLAISRCKITSLQSIEPANNDDIFIPDFNGVYKSLEEDIRAKHITQLKTKQGFVSVEGRISLGNQRSLELLYIDFIRQGIYDLSVFSTNELNNRISILSKGEVQSLNTNIVWAVLQELLKRAKAIIECPVKNVKVSFDEAYNNLVYDLKESGEKLTFERPRSSSFEVSVGKDSVLRIDGVAINKDLVRSFYDQTNSNNWYSKHCEIIIDYLRNHYKLDNNNVKDNTENQIYSTHPNVIEPSQKKKPFIFIIDEINRGEISKIFGELFFSIDPGYRGEKGKVNTQYQNMIEEGDVFKDGFYVPENVYIIGTMNDIDRSVESMDFAMRRRFAWEEITAKKSFTNMIENDPDYSLYKDEIKARMFNLNKAIVATEGLDEAYQIGAAYFRKVLDYQDRTKPFDCLWENHLKGLLFEYLRGNRRSKELLEKLHNAYNKLSLDE